MLFILQDAVRHPLSLYTLYPDMLCYASNIYIYSTGHLKRKPALRKQGLNGQKNKNFRDRYTAVGAERTHSQVRNPAWTSFPVSYH